MKSLIQQNSDVLGLNSITLMISFTEVEQFLQIILLSILETCRKKKLPTKIYNSSSTDCFGGKTKTCNEKTIFSPVSPYGRAKSSSHWLVRYYRDFFNVSCVSGIVSNHESTLRSENFVTKKIIMALCRIKLKKQHLPHQLRFKYQFFLEFETFVVLPL